MRGADRAGARILCALCADWAAVDAAGKLLRAMLLQAFYSIRSERQLMERLEYDLLFRWFVGIGVDAAVWDHSVFSKNRDRLLEGNIAARFLAAVLDQPRVKKLLSTDHFTVDGTLIEAWASSKSFKPRDGSDEPPASGGRNTEADFHGKKRSNETHVSTTDPDARLYRKGPGKEAKLCFIGTNTEVEKCLRHKGFRRVPGKVLQSVLQPSFLIPSSPQDRRSACRIALACRP